MKIVETKFKYSGCIYMLVCTKNEKKYVGQTTQLKERVQQHFSPCTKNSKRPLYLDVTKYGKENFSVVVLENIQSNDFDEFRKKMYKSEIAAILLYDTIDNGYNLELGKLKTDATKEKYSRLFSGKNNPRYGATVTEETRRKISDANKGQTAWNKGKECPQLQGDKNGFFGKHHTDETKKIISLKKKGKKNQKISDSKRGTKASLETRAKLSAIRKGVPKTEEFKAIMAIKMKAVWEKRRLNKIKQGEYYK